MLMTAHLDQNTDARASALEQLKTFILLKTADFLHQSDNAYKLLREL
jgi:hypothetical protein